MKLYIVRHAIAEKQKKNIHPIDDRLLTKTGIRKMSKNAEAIAKIVSFPISIISSPLKRAFHTSEILASKIEQSVTIVRSNNLLPETSVDKIIQLCKKYSKHTNILIVGHEPSLGEFLRAALHQKIQPFVLKKGSLCCIEFNTEQPKKSAFLFYMPPKVLRALIR